MKKLKMISWLALVAGLLLAVSCGEGELQRESRTVELGGAQSVSVDVTMGAGKLVVAGGANALLDAEFVYNVPDWKPEVKYNVDQGQGKLTIQQPVSLDINLGRNRYEWELRLNETVPMDMDIKLGAGDNDLDLGDLYLTELDLNMGAGDVSLDLTGEWHQDLDALIRGGVGKVTLRLPADTGVRIDVTGGLGQVTAIGLRKEDGDLVNDAYGNTEATLYIDIQGAVGQVNLEVID